MKAMKIIAAIALAAVPIVSQASEPESESLQANREPFNANGEMQTVHANAGQLDTASALTLEGESVAESQALKQVAFNTRHGTMLPDAELDTPHVGHDASW